MEDDAPFGVELGLFAVISSDLAEGDTTVSQVLRRHGVEERVWANASASWTRRIAVDATSDEPALAERYSDAFTARQDAYRDIAPMSPEAWAELVAEMGRGEGTKPLDARGLSQSDYLRMSRHWARTLGRSPELAERFAQRGYEMNARR